MTDESCVTLDINAFDAVSESKDKLVNDYNKINSDYKDTVITLLNNWEGHGADAFREDSTKIKTNISGIQDILKTMCDTLTDCHAVFAESDKGMGEYNADPFSE